MTFWARLTWQVPDPAALGEDLARRLGLSVTPGGLVPEALTVSLGSAVIELRPWRAESAGERPLPSGRLVFEPVPGGEEAPAPGGDEATGPGNPGMPATRELPLTLAGVGWATVELDRAEEELDPWLAPRATAVGGDEETGDGTEPHLGGRSRRRGAGGLPAGSIVLLEPSTEGRLVVSLARNGEGPCALYLAPHERLRAWLRAARDRGVRTSAIRPGPLGPSALVLGGATSGPHLILVDPSWPSSNRSPAGTISA